MNTEELIKLTKAELLTEMKNCQASGSDLEMVHGTADEILCARLIQLGETDLVNEWEKVEKWYA